jgi:hypothetical protein
MHQTEWHRIQPAEVQDEHPVVLFPPPGSGSECKEGSSMSDLEAVVARGISMSNVELEPRERQALARTMAAELRANADVVRMEMEMVVWGMVK